MKFIKLNNIQAKKISGRYDHRAINPRFVAEGFYILNIDIKIGIASRYLKKLLKAGTTKTIDTTKSNADAMAIKAMLEETEKQGDDRQKTRLTKWDYMAMIVDKEL